MPACGYLSLFLYPKVSGIGGDDAAEISERAVELEMDGILFKKTDKRKEQ